MFLHNLRALWRRDPAVALRVDAVPDEERLPLEPTRTGAWTVRVATPDGQATYLHSRYDPVAEAERFIDSVPIEDKFCFVLSGSGLGYPVQALFNRLRGNAFIICIEPSIRLLATALSCVDLSDVIASGRLILLFDDDKTRLHERLKDFGTLMMLGAQFIRHAPSMRVAGEEYAAISSVIAEFVTYTRMSLLTLVSKSRITCQNIGTAMTDVTILYSEPAPTTPTTVEDVPVNGTVLFYQPNSLVPVGFNGSAIITADEDIVCIVNENQVDNPASQDWLLAYNALATE